MSDKENLRGRQLGYIHVNANLTIDGFIELLDFIEEPDEDLAGPESNVA